MLNSSSLNSETALNEKAKKIKLLLMDCDGVLTDGRLYFAQGGEELKVFHVRDGQGLVMWHQAGFRSGIISGRKSKIVKTRAAELGIHYVKIGSKDKLKDFEEIIEDANLTFEEVAYVGDDIPDIELLRTVGLGIAVADAAEEVFSCADYTTRAKGGLGAIREVTNLLLKARRMV